MGACVERRGLPGLTKTEAGWAVAGILVSNNRLNRHVTHHGTGQIATSQACNWLAVVCQKSFETVNAQDATHGGSTDGRHRRQRVRTPLRGMSRLAEPPASQYD